MCIDLFGITTFEALFRLPVYDFFVPDKNPK